jgi:nitroreductase
MFMSLIQKRRSIRKFQPKALEPEKIEALVEAALRAPTSRGLQPWQFVVVDDPQLLAKLAQTKEHGSSFLKGAALAFVICADPTQSDVWVEDTAIAATFIQLAAEHLELASCWSQIRLRPHNASQTAQAYLCETLQIPKHLEIDALIAIGYPAEGKAGHSADSLPYDKVHRNLYGKPFRS